MRILFVSSGNSKSGISPIVRNQAQSLADQAQIDFFLIRGKGPGGYASNIPLLKSMLSKERYDIIHAHFGLSGVISDLARRNEKLVVSFMGSDLIESKQKKPLLSLKRKLIIRLNQYFSLNRFDFSIVKSDQMKQLIKGGNRVATVPNGVDFDRFYPVDQESAQKELKLDLGKKYILFAADPNNHVKNFPLAKKSYLAGNFDNVVLRPAYGLDQTVLNLYYNAADVLLLTSFHEGSPNVIKEAMACNCPIVSTDVGDVKAVIKDTPGCHIASWNESHIALKLKEVFRFGGRTIGRQQIAHLESKTIAGIIISIYEGLL